MKTSAGGAPLYDHQAAKKAARLRVNSDLLKRAHELGIDPSAALEEALAEAIAQKQGAVWLEENRAAIEAYNELIAEHGVFSSGLRSF
jgi:antitoxin CcdA